MSGVLDGIRVIDFGQYMAGPMAGMFLGDFGADVIRVERPGGPVYDVPANATWNRNKRSITLDLNTVEDLAVARDLVAHADVVIENFRPDMMAKWGLDWDTVKKTNPGLVYCAIKGFAATDPRYRLKATEDIVAAAAGIHAPTPISGIKHPVYTAIPLSSMYGAHWAAVSIGMALNAREQSGIGQFIEVPLFGVALTAFSGKLMRVGDAPEPEPRASGRYAMCQDGRWLMYFPKSIGSKPALMEEMGMPWYKDTIEEAERERRAAVVFATQPTEYWSDAFARHGIEGVVCNRPQDWVRHHLARDTKAVEAFEDPVLGRFVGPGIIPRLSETPGTVRSPRPLPNQHGAAIRDELKCWARPQERSVHPILSALEGIKVVDMGIVLASPSCGRTLAEFGANLIKVDSPARNPLSWHNDINRGKRSILLDLKHPRGKAIFWKLLEDADVVLENFRAGVAERMGFGYEAIRARNPGVIYSSVNAYGQGGTYTLRPGREPLSQAITGMQMRYGGTRLGQQELYGAVLDDNPGALWNRANLEATRIKASEVPVLVRIVVGVDPAVTSGEDSDSTGIVVAGLSGDGNYYVLADDTIKASPQVWAEKAISSFEQHKADRIIAEVNNGGDLVVHLLQQVKNTVPVKKVTASRGKAVRAEPIAALFEQGRAHLVGYYPELEDQLCEWEPGTNMSSPDRMDAMVWALTELSEGSNALAYLASLAVFCPNCKTPLPKNTFTCPKCGTPIGDTNASTINQPNA